MEPNKLNEGERQVNIPEPFFVKLLFVEKPWLDKEAIFNELKTQYPDVEMDDNTYTYAFPDIVIESEEGPVPAHCVIVHTDLEKGYTEIPDAVFRFNNHWSWPNAIETAKACRYEVTLTDFMSTNLTHTQRNELFCHFVMAVTKVLLPNAIYSGTSQRLISPDYLISRWKNALMYELDLLVNIRSFSFSENGKKEIFMDTMGMNSFGLPDLQVRFTKHEPMYMGALLLTHAYYLYENGDVIEDGDLMMSMAQKIEWASKREKSFLPPERIVIHILPD